MQGRAVPHRGCRGPAARAAANTVRVQSRRLFEAMQTMRSTRRFPVPLPSIRSVALVLATGALAPAWAQENSPPSDEQDAAETGAVAITEARRILHLRGGSTVRAVARP